MTLFEIYNIIYLYIISCVSHEACCVKSRNFKDLVDSAKIDHYQIVVKRLLQSKTGSNF